MAGENPMWVAKQMGHTDWSLTAKRYARWIPGDMPDAGAAWSQLGHNVLQMADNKMRKGGLEPPRREPLDPKSSICDHCPLRNLIKPSQNEPDKTG
jgi:hypothetical protein